MRYPVKLEVNGAVHEASVEPHTTLLALLRDYLGLTGTKLACGTGDCGTCTVLMDGRPVTSCLVLAPDASGRRVSTIEGVTHDGKLHALQQAFVEQGAVQCGYCTPGMIIMAKALLDDNPRPTEQEIRAALQGNLCRCTGYNKIVDAIMVAASR